MDAAVQTWNDYSTYGYNFPVYYDSGIPTAQANYLGSIGFGGQGNYRVAMHESAHWLGTGSVFEWDAHQRFGVWNGTYAVNLRRAYDGPGERQFIYGVHYGPDGANYDEEGVNGPRFVGTVGAFRRDMNLGGGDQTIGIASGNYRLRQRVAVKMLENASSGAEGAQPTQDANNSGDSQLWNVSLQLGTPYFTIQNVAGGKYLDSLGATGNGSPVGLTSLAGGIPSDSQLWQIIQTDSFFFKIVNKANGKGLDNLGATGDGEGISQWDAAGNFSWNQHWTFLNALPQTVADPAVVSQGRPVTSSSTEANHYDNKGNNGVAADRWTAADASYPQWWRVDTGIVQPITRVEIDWFKDGSPAFQYQIEVSNNDSDWTVVADRTSNGVSGTTVDPLTGVSGRFVRVTVTGVNFGGYFAAFYECRVFNENTPLKNLSQFRPTSASTEQVGNLAVNANDVDPVFTRWCADSSGYPAWWQVDLGSVRQVNRAVIAWFDDGARSYQYRIEGSTDGTNFTTLADRTGNTDPYTTADEFSGSARYVRIMVTGGSADWPSIYDAQIFGATALDPTDLAGTVVGEDVSLSWTAAAGATGYQVKRSTTKGGPYLPVGSEVVGTGFVDDTVSPGTVYYYVVTAKSGTEEGGTSGEVRVTTPGTLALWDFEDGVAGQSFTPTGQPNGSGGSVDTVSGILMRGYDTYAGPTWTSAAPPNGDGLAMLNADNHQDGYVTEGVLHGWSPEEWTIECTVFLESLTGWNTFIGRDGASHGEPESDFYLQNSDGDDRFRVSIETVGGQRWILDGNYTVEANTWYALAARSDGSTLSLWLDDGTGYQQIGSLDITAQSVADNALPASDFAWTFGRGWFGGGLTDHIDGGMDNIRFTDGALGPEEMIPLVLLTPEQQWRLDHFGTTENVGDAADDADPDGDGWINADERDAGTDPNDRGSNLRFTSLSPSGADYVLVFPSVVGRIYTVEYSDNLGAASWQPVLTAGVPAIDLVGTGGPIQVIDSGGAGHGRRFYRISVGP
ncbi:coagulation factor 5/8type domain-containing protein [Haloferula helveola]|uniref:Coagulation factor 5/8type domain-containing protein n=2 Tax=Haloferula helveola TaxID=490095 RepID=A0ABN6H3G4_9BACT|nr:coagulation factor 5/8type domain-containing protein [Haloferula helveola]